MYRLQRWYTAIAVISGAVALGRRPVPPHRPFGLGLDGLSGWHHWQEVSYRSSGPMGGCWNRIRSQLPSDLFSCDGFPYKPIRASRDWSEPMMWLRAGPGLAVSSRVRHLTIWLLHNPVYVASPFFSVDLRKRVWALVSPMFGYNTRIYILFYINCIHLLQLLNILFFAKVFLSIWQISIHTDCPWKPRGISILAGFTLQSRPTASANQKRCGFVLSRHTLVLSPGPIIAALCSLYLCSLLKRAQQEPSKAAFMQPGQQ